LALRSASKLVETIGEYLRRPGNGPLSLRYDAAILGESTEREHTDRTSRAREPDPHGRTMTVKRGTHIWLGDAVSSHGP